MTQPIYIDATMLYRWRDHPPVGVVRLERTLASHLRFSAEFGQASYLMWDRGYRYATAVESEQLDQLLRDIVAPAARSTERLPEITSGSRVLPRVRRVGLRGLAAFPDSIRPYAERAAWAWATLGVESIRHVRHASSSRRNGDRSSRTIDTTHSVDFRGGADLIAVGLGWEYLDHEAMYDLKVEHGVRIHMPAFDLIPIVMPQMNFGQSHLIHRYYAEMAHYAETITCISEATAVAVRRLYMEEQLPMPHIETNPLPAFDPPPRLAESAVARHRFEGERFVLSVSTIEIRKNHLLLAKIWSECIREGHEMPRLVLVGRIGWDVNELMQWAYHAPELDDRMTIRTDVSDGELAELYRDAEFTVFPSRIEGWGLPITESLSMGKVCVHSTDPAQLEASQGLMPALHPDDFLAWKATILELTGDTDRLRSLESTIAERFARRTPDDYCRDFEQIITSRRMAPA